MEKILGMRTIILGGRVKIEEKMLKELEDYGIEELTSARVDYETGEIVFNEKTEIWED